MGCHGNKSSGDAEFNNTTLNQQKESPKCNDTHERQKQHPKFI